jgi:hypothetical protein
MALGFRRQALLHRRGQGIPIHAAVTAEELFHRFLVERVALIVEAGKEQVFLALVGVDLELHEGQESALPAQGLDHMQARRVVRHVENDASRGC